MRFKKREPLFSVLLDTGINLLDSLRERLPDNADDIKDRVRDTYDTATRRVSSATNALRGKEDSQIIGKVGALLIGVGIGVSVGLLIAPASGDRHRPNNAAVDQIAKDLFAVIITGSNDQKNMLTVAAKKSRSRSGSYFALWL